MLPTRMFALQMAIFPAEVFMSDSNSAKLMDDLHRIVRDIEDILSGSADDISDKSRDAHHRASEALHRVKSKIADASAQAAEQARAASDATVQYVKNNPWQSLGLAAGFGLLVGFLLRRRD
jgi:ElaB/YqjD/DUF883 family membrane-anchored ribosome-binding protein